MKFRALVAVLGLLYACAAPDPADTNRPKVELVEHARPNGAATLEFRVVDDGSAYMKSMLEHVGLADDGQASDVEAIADGVRAKSEQWRMGGKTLTDFYLTASTRGALAHYVDTLAAHDAAFKPPADHELGFEQTDAGAWRTLYLTRTAELDTPSITHADSGVDSSSQRATVLIDLAPADAQRFGALTTRIAGHKLAVMVDGTVLATPIINGPITGGRVQITLDDDAHAQALADALNVR